MDLLIRWPCPSVVSGPCRVCFGKGYIERWVRSEALHEVEQTLGRGLVVRRHLDRPTASKISPHRPQKMVTDVV